jgi:hypothetical protein
VKGFLERSDAAVKRDYNDDIAAMWPEADREQDETTKRWKPKIAEDAPKDGWIIEVQGYTYHELAKRGFLNECLLANFLKLNQFADMTQVDPITKKPKVSLVIPGLNDPIKSNVKYPFFYLALEAPGFTQANFKYIKSSYVNSLMIPASAGMMGGPGGPPGGDMGTGATVGNLPGGGGPGRGGGSPDGGDGMTMPGTGAGMPGTPGTWQPLPGSGNVAGGPGMGMGMPGSEGGMGAPGGGMGLAIPGAGGMPGGPPGGAPMTGISGGGGGRGAALAGGGSSDGGEVGIPGGGGLGQPNSPAMPPKGKPKVRTEFVLVFVWREPTPSDPTPAGAAATDTATPAPGGP